jgi:hypothetical protein
VKFKIKDSDDFEITELKVIKERTRARIVTRTVTAWLGLILIIAIEAIWTGHRDDLQALLRQVTPLVTMAFGWYLGREYGK